MVSAYTRQYYRRFSSENQQCFKRLVVAALIFLGVSGQVSAYEKYLDISHGYSPLIFVPERITVEVKVDEQVKDFAARLEQENITNKDAFLYVARNINFHTLPFVPAPRDSIKRFEGLFRPGDYVFSTEEVHPLPEERTNNYYKRALENAKVVIFRLLNGSKDYFASIKPRHGLSVYEQIILASIVEKEAVPNRDYDKIASVFYNRLRSRDRLGSCPTVEYALGYHRPFLTYSDVKIDSPYNVYERRGLPPTPICFFSDRAFEAVNTPLESDLYFFVFDWTKNEFKFAVSYDDHKINANIARSNFIRYYGRDALHEIFPGKFYEQ